MKRIVLFLLVICFPFVIVAQDTSILKIKNDSTDIELHSLSVSVQIVGNIATTETKMTFYNPNNRILEGELNFPLKEGQQVHRFAMDVNGKLREGVVVEKQKGRQAFEGVVRQQIDPGLLEKTVGNNYKARVYPIPANGYKTVVVGYEEELNGQHEQIYQLLMDYGEVSEFALQIEVVKRATKPHIESNDLINFFFEEWRDSYLAERHEVDFNASGMIRVALPMERVEQVMRSTQADADYFYATVSPNVKEVYKDLPDNIGLLWDVSFSASRRDTVKEFALIRKYLNNLKKVNIQVLIFSNCVIDKRSFLIENGDGKELLAYLKSQTYDGGTQLKTLFENNLNAREYILFSDGVSTLADLPELSGMAPIHVVNSNRINNADELNTIAVETGGRYISLLTTSVDDALKQLLTTPFQYLGASYDKGTVTELFPRSPAVISEGDAFSISGKIMKNKAVTLDLMFGRPEQVEYTKRLYIDTVIQDAPIDRLWAKKKLAHLALRAKQNEQQITQLGKKYKLVTPYTSLIVLDRVEDYVRYEIAPPEEIKEVYDSLMKQKIIREEKNGKELIQQLESAYSQRVIWWENEKKGRKTSARLQQTANETPVNSTAESASVNEQRAHAAIDTSVFTQLVDGQIFDETHEPIPGVSVYIKDNPSIGISSNINGEFSIRTRPDDILVFAFVGFKVKELPVMATEEWSVQLENDVLALEEVVVIEDDVDIEAAEYMTLENESHVNQTNSVSVVANAVQVQVAGVQTQASSSNSMVVRGNSQRLAGDDLLYIVDGQVVSAADFTVLERSEFAEVKALQAEEATALYGRQAANGVVIAVTREAATNGITIPDSVTALVDQTFIAKSWTPNAPYLDSLENMSPSLLYSNYQKLRDTHGNTPGFYLAVGDLMLKKGANDMALRIFSTIADLELENHELLKLLAHRFLQQEAYNESLFLYGKIVELRPDEPQSKRDLALAYEASGQLQQALDLMLEILETDLHDDRFPKIKSTVLYEMNHLIAIHKGDLDLSEVPDSFIKDMPVDIRVVLDWNTLETDMDLWVIEPSGEKCYYKKPLTSLGGRLTADYTDGYGPEEYLLKDAVPGEYTIKVDYYDDRVQKLSGPITLQVTVFNYYGSKKEQVKKFTLQLEKEEDVVEVGRFEWK